MWKCLIGQSILANLKYEPLDCVCERSVSKFDDCFYWTRFKKFHFSLTAEHIDDSPGLLIEAILLHDNSISKRDHLTSDGQEKFSTEVRINFLSWKNLI